MSYASLRGPAGQLPLPRGRTQLPISVVGANSGFVQVGNNFRLTDLGTYQVALDLTAQAAPAAMCPLTAELWNITTATLIASEDINVTPVGGVNNAEFQVNFDFAVANILHQFGLFVNVTGNAFLGGPPVFLVQQTWTAEIRQQMPAPPALVSALNTTDKNLVPNACAANFSDTGLVIGAEPADDGYVLVLVNGQQQSVGNGDRAHDFYFSADGGATAKTFATLAAGDALFFNALIAGFPIGPVDRIDLDYCV